MHVSWYEADAFARWRGARLPTEAEWEKAARDAERARYPWGDEPPRQRRTSTSSLRPRRAPRRAPPAACRMIGDCWEWTASAFDGYPGFDAFPYREYSEVFFGGDYRVLRGGSWATRPSVARNTFRNWDLPERRQIFAGFRCARR